jgi:thiamine pyrophosphokinase
MSICVFTGGLYPAPEHVAHIFSTVGLPDYVIVADSGLYAAEAYKQRYHFGINCITGDMDSLESSDILSRYPSEIIECHPRDKDDTDTALALRKAMLRRGINNEPVILVGGDGGRLDHTLAIMHLFGSPLAPDIWLGASQAVYAVGERHCKMLEISGLTESDPVSIFAANGHEGTQRKIQASGLFWDIENLKWDAGAYSLSNKIDPAYEGKPVRFEAASGVFLVMAPLNAKLKISRKIDAE